MGARARVRDLRDRAGVGAARAGRGAHERLGRALGRVGDGPRRGVLLVLLRRDRDREVAVPEGSERGVGARVPVRVDEPRVGARAGAVGADRLAVHRRRVRRRSRDDRADDRAAAPVRQPPARAAGARARPGGRQRPSAPRGGRAAVLARAAHLGAGVVGCGAQLPRRLADALQGDRARVPARRVHRPVRQRVLRAPVPPPRAGAAADDRERDRRPDHRRAQLRLLGRERPARRRAVVRRDLVRRGARVPVRRPDRDPDPR